MTQVQSAEKEQERRLKASYDAFYRTEDFAHFRHEIQYIRFLASLLPPQRRSTGRVLDVGCGTGFYTGLFSALGLKSCGVDLSATALERAVQQAPGPDLCMADATSLPFKDQAFSMVFCHGFSLFDASLGPALQAPARELIRCLEKEGLFIFSWSSNLRGGRRRRNWREHTLREVREFLSGLDMRVEATYFLDRRILLRLFGRRAFNPVITRLASFVSWATGLPGLIVCIARKPAA